MRAILQELIYDSLREGAVWPFNPHYIRPPHFHGQLECLLIRRGSATLRLGARAASVRAGQLCWILPGVPHVMDDFSADFDMWVIELDAALVDTGWRELASATLGSCGDVFASWPVVLAERLAGRAAIDLGALEAGRIDELALLVWSAVSPAEARPALRSLCDLVLRATTPRARRPGAPSVAELASCLLLMSPALDRTAVAAELGVSEGFLSRQFHRQLGVTFVEQRARTRVVHFLSHLGRGRHNLLGAALEAGFGSYSQFHRIFTRMSGSRPRDYLDGGRHQRQLLVAAGAGRPRSDDLLELPERQRHRAPWEM